MEVVYEETKDGLTDQRVKLSSPSGIKVGDRFSRNGEAVVHVYELDEFYLVTTEHYEHHLGKTEEVIVWRVKVS